MYVIFRKYNDGTSANIYYFSEWPEANRTADILGQQTDSIWFVAKINQVETTTSEDSAPAPCAPPSTNDYSPQQRYAAPARMPTTGRPY